MCGGGGGDAYNWDKNKRNMQTNVTCNNIFTWCKQLCYILQFQQNKDQHKI